MGVSPKILFYVNVLCKGGAERVILQLARQFHNAGYEAVMVTSFIGEDEYEMPSGVRRIVMEKGEKTQSRLMRNVSRIIKLRRVLKEENADVLISFMQEPNFRAVLAALGLKTKVIVSVRNDPNKEYAGKLGRFVGKRILPIADGCVFQTEEAKAWFPEKLQEKSAIILNEVTESFFHVSRQRTSDIVTVGRLNAQKNHAMLIRAFAKVAEKYPAERLLIYGEGECAQQLTKQIEALGLGGRVCLMGTTSQVESVLAKASVFVLSSDYEGLPNALMEAMAAGVPSIATDCPCGGPRMLIKHGENGLLVPVGDEKALAEAMDRLLADQAYREQLSSASRKDAYRYMPDRVFQEWKAYVGKCAI